MAIQGDLSQENRTGSLQTPLGKDQLVLEKFEGTESLSDLFDFTVTAVSKIANIDFDKLLGETAKVAIASGHPGVKRNFHAHVTKARWVNSANGLHVYKLQMRPWLWFLTKTSNCRIFSNKSVVDIIKEVFSKYDFAKFESRLTQSYQPMEYCVQYRESDFDFVSRLMEEFGIYYHFEHSEEEHCMVLGDGLSSHKPKAGGAKLTFNDGHATTQAHSLEDLLHSLFPSRRVRTGKVTLNSHNYKKPPTDLLAHKESNSSYKNGKLEQYHFNWRHMEKELGTDFAKIKLEAEQALDKLFSATGNAVTCSPGSLMKLDKHPEDAFNIEHLIVSAEHEYTAESYLAQNGEGDKYSGSYQFQPSDTPYRASLDTPRPRIYGAQVALVINDEVDELCRIQVKFPWVQGDDLSRWAPVAQSWAGDGWGDVKIPRIGMEVIVNFLDGDPDHPVITGCIYSAVNRPPYSLPKDKSISGTKTQTYEGSGYNEFIMDDRKNKELIRLHAQKDMHSAILHDESHAVGHDVSISVGHNRTEHIGDTWNVHSEKKINLVVPFVPPPPKIPDPPADIVGAIASTVSNVGGALNSVAQSVGAPLGLGPGSAPAPSLPSGGIFGMMPGNMPPIGALLGGGGAKGGASQGSGTSSNGSGANQGGAAKGASSAGGVPANPLDALKGLAGGLGKAMAGGGQGGGGPSPAPNVMGMLGGMGGGLFGGGDGGAGDMAAGAAGGAAGGGGMIGDMGVIAGMLGGLSSQGDPAGSPMGGLGDLLSGIPAIADMISPKITMTNTDITISVGASMIILNAMGIQITAPQVAISSMSTATINSPLTALNTAILTQVTSPIVNIEGEVFLHSPPIILPF